MPRSDERVLKARLARIARAVEEIERDLPPGIDAFLGPDGERLLAALEYRLVVALQAAIDVATHICAAEGFGAPDSYRDAMERLGRRGVLPPDLVQPMATGVGLRNVLIHEYLEVDPARVLAALRDVGDLKRFAAAIWDWADF